jgi:N-acetyl-gamma-glutamyl-phosphate reductase
MSKLKAGIVGGAGYTGGELIRLLIHHPQVEIAFVHSKSNAGNALSNVHQDLLGDTDLKFTGELSGNIDVVFLCVGHGEARKFLEGHLSTLKGVKLIDLSQDFRLTSNNIYPGSETHDFVYGLPELNREAIRKADYIANPGCFASSIVLGLLPLAKAGLLDEVYTTGITGSTGAGQSLSQTGHFSWRVNNIQAYKTLRHQHLKEIVETLQHLQPSFSATTNTNGETKINFIPWRGDFARGIFISSQMSCNWEEKDLIELYKEFYEDHPFIFLSAEPIYLKQVVNTNKCIVQVEKVGSKLVVHSILDNLLKGASGQAVQNMNLMFGLNECSGLRLKATGF